MTATLMDVQEMVSQLSFADQLKLAARICEQVSREADDTSDLRMQTRAQREAALAYCDTVAEQIPGAFDSAEDMRRIRDDRTAERE